MSLVSCCSCASGAAAAAFVATHLQFHCVTYAMVLRLPVTCDMLLLILLRLSVTRDMLLLMLPCDM